MDWKFPETYSPDFTFLKDLLTGFPELQKHIAGQPSFYSTNFVEGGLDGSADGPNGTVPTWHMFHVFVGPFENLDYHYASYPEIITAPYRFPRSLLELLLWQGFKMHTHGCELSGKYLTFPLHLDTNILY